MGQARERGPTDRRGRPANEAQTWAIDPPSADGLLRSLEVADAGFADQYHAVQRFMRQPEARGMPGAVRSDLRNRNLLARRGNGRVMECDTLEDARANIDRVDQQLVELLGERAAYVRQAGAFKRSDAEVAAPERVEQVIARAREVARQRGLDPDLVGRIYEPLVAAFVEAERAERAARREIPPPDVPADRPRTALDDIWDEGPTRTA